MSWACRTWRG